MCDIVFEETKGHGGTVNKTSVYAAAAPQAFFKKYVIRNFAEFTRSHNLFLVLFWECCKIYKNTCFAEQHRTTASDYSSINSSEGSIGKQNCKL